MKWNHESVRLEALKYDTRYEFCKGSGGAYRHHQKRGLLDEVCSHMTVVGNSHNRCVYVCKFPDNHCYIGLTYNMVDRKSRRIKDDNDAVTKHKNETGLDYTYEMLTDGYLDVQLASKLEGEYLEEYKNNGWEILNRCKTGGLGGMPEKWTHELVKLEALKYKTRYSFDKGSKGACKYARKYKIMDEVCSHMVSNRLNHESVRLEALKYKTRTDFSKGSSGAYKYARRHKLLDELFPK